MGILGRLFGRNSTPTSTPLQNEIVPSADARSDTSATSRQHRLVFEAPFKEVDAQLVDIVNAHTKARLDGLQERFLGVFDTLLEGVGESAPKEFVADHLEALTDHVSKWSVDVPQEIHEAIVESLKGAWDLKAGADPLDQFFGVYANASHYDAIMHESVMKAAIETFDGALERAVRAFPSLTAADQRELAAICHHLHWRMQMEWEDMRRARFNALVFSGGDDIFQHVIVGETIEMFRAFFTSQVTNAIRSYRHSLLPVVTSNFVESDMTAALEQLDGEAKGVLLENAFSGAPFAQADFAHTPQLLSSYVFAWYDAWGRREDLKESATTKGLNKYAEEIALVDLEEQFTRYGAVHIDTEWQVLFAEIRSFYARELANRTIDS